MKATEISKIITSSGTIRFPVSNFRHHKVPWAAGNSTLWALGYASWLELLVGSLTVFRNVASRKDLLFRMLN